MTLRAKRVPPSPLPPVEPVAMVATGLTPGLLAEYLRRQLEKAGKAPHVSLPTYLVKDIALALEVRVAGGR